MSALSDESWGPYAVGAGIGLLEIVSMATVKRPLGVSSAFEKLAAGATEVVSPETAKRYREAGGDEAELGWETALVGGVLLGSLASAVLSGAREQPPVWSPRRSTSSGLGRAASAVLGGASMMFGARMAKGCTSGHGISGTMQLAASSWAFTAVMFASGAATALSLFGRKG